MAKEELRKKIDELIETLPSRKAVKLELFLASNPWATEEDINKFLQDIEKEKENLETVLNSQNKNEKEAEP